MTMNIKRLSSGTAHRLTKDLRTALIGSPAAIKTWQDITPLARNEYICWTKSAKKLETRQRRIRIAIEKLTTGERRPCCWPGCTHRT